MHEQRIQQKQHLCVYLYWWEKFTTFLTLNRQNRNKTQKKDKMQIFATQLNFSLSLFDHIVLYATQKQRSKAFYVSETLLKYE